MKKHTFWERVKRHKKMLGGVCVFALCIGILAAAGGGLKTPDAVKSNQAIPEHDGDVLVDSIHVQEETEASKDGQKDSQKESSKKDSELVTSDDVSDLENSDTYFEEMRATIDTGSKRSYFYADRCGKYGGGQLGKRKRDPAEASASRIHGAGTECGKRHPHKRAA